jgi:hypothetical protein
MEKPHLFNAIVAEFLTPGASDDHCGTFYKPEWSRRD